MISVQIDADKIREMAYEISQEQKSYDEFVWFCAEAELRIRPALAYGKLYKDGEESQVVQIDPDMIVDQPAEEDIRTTAEEIAKQAPSVQDVHWFTAERRFIYDAAKNS
ncbi:MAG TPA: hypothetical protein VKK79_11970 [Candidatus Lokiarchaeia archaeon]|nr:hypothetical protein [Candidatus Lokiarchaeia archaeon]